MNKFKSKKKRLFKKEKHIENLNKNGKRYNKIKKKFFSKFDSKYIQFNYRQDELPFKKKTEIKVKIEQKLKSLLELTKKNNNLLLNSKKFFLNLIKKKTCCFKFNKIEEKNLFNCKSTKFSNRVGFFFSYFQTLKIFFISYKFCFYFMMLNEIYQSKNFLKECFFSAVNIKKKQIKKYFNQKNFFNTIFLKKLKDNWLAIIEIYVKYFINKNQQKHKNYYLLKKNKKP